MKKIIQAFNETTFENDVIYYGFQVLMFNLLAVLLVLIISLLSNTIFFGIYFIICFACFRIPAGGFHCKTPISCLLLTGLVYLIIVISYKNIDIPNILLIILIGCIVFRGLQKNQKNLLLPSMIMIIIGIFDISSISALVYGYLTFQVFYYIRYKCIY